MMKNFSRKSANILLCATALLATLANRASGQSSINEADSARDKFYGLPLAQNAGEESNGKILDRYGVPFREEILPLAAGGSAQVPVGAKAKRIFLLGMTDTDKLPTPAQLEAPSSQSILIRPTTPAQGWADPRETSVRFFVGDHLGQIRLEYADGSTQIFPLILGEGVWWGRAFFDYPEPFPTDPTLRKALASALRLYPPAPVPDGNYVAVIVPKPAPIRAITFENTPVKKGTLVIAGITIETAQTNNIPGATLLTPAAISGSEPDAGLSQRASVAAEPRQSFSLSPGERAGVRGSGNSNQDLMFDHACIPPFETFIKTKSLRPIGQDERQTEHQLNELRLAAYSSDADYQGHVAKSVPPGYSDPDISFQGTVFAEILANVLRYNAQDIADKIDAEGMYHTSTKDAPSWGGYHSVGFFRKNLGRYYDASFSRDGGRSLQELAALGDTNDTARCADYCLRMARLYTTEPRLKFKGTVLPPHWAQLINRPSKGSFENDGQGLTTMFLYKLWERLPGRDEWLRSRWPDIKAACDWILWQFDHPEISGATNGLLHTTGEAAAGNGCSVFADSACMNALQALAQMADSIGETNSATLWRDRADKMRQAITEHYIVNDPKYGRVWTLEHADWPHKSGVLGPLIFQADYQGFAPEDSNPDWRAVNEATYQRLIDTYTRQSSSSSSSTLVAPKSDEGGSNQVPFGFYGQAMGYGQGFVTEAALLLDRMHDATTMLDWVAKQTYDPKFGSYIVPEGCQIDSTGRFWFRMGDVGNGVQEGEIVKTLRIVIGVDDTQPGRLQFFPRIPYGWKKIAVEKYPVVFERAGKLEIANLKYQLERSSDELKLTIAADEDPGPVTMRLGPFEKQPVASSVRVNGKIPANPSIERSGDSWWVRFTTRL